MLETFYMSRSALREWARTDGSVWAGMYDEWIADQGQIPGNVRHLRSMAASWATEAEGWYGWYCFPGCLPDSDPVGPFDSEDEAVTELGEDADDV